MLIAAAGHAGTGKTTALRFLCEAGLGHYEYVGAKLREAVVDRGYALNPANEQIVREELRNESGMGAMAKLALPSLRDKLARGHVFVDAIYNIEERDVYVDAFGPAVVLIGIEAPVDLRCERLQQRAERPLSREDVLKRDEFENETLKLGDVISQAEIVIRNASSMDYFEAQLRRLAERFLVI